MSVRIHGLTVCVGYSKYLKQILPNWLSGLTTLTVVTTPGDSETIEVVSQNYPSKLGLHLSQKFTENGALFNKGAAMEEARQHMPWEDWIVFFDSDILVEPNWHSKLKGLNPGTLYGCRRHQINHDLRFHPINDDRVGYGYFQLFHSSDHPHKAPLLDTHWRHAGNYDSSLLLKYRDRVVDLGFWVGHLGYLHNWFGIGRQDLFEQMEKDRKDKGMNGPLERI